MKCYTYNLGQISEGIAIREDEKLGEVIFLGEAGRGRRYEKLALARRNPAEVIEGRVLNVNLKKITLPAKDGRPEKSFYILEKPFQESNEILVRVDTCAGYVRNAAGYWKTVEGSPETVIKAYGAYGDAGRIGSWDDGLIKMKAGDVLKIHPSQGEHSFALWLNENDRPQTAIWKDFENIMAVQKAEELIAQASEQSESLCMVSDGSLPCFSFRGGQITPGIEISQGSTGQEILLGENGRGRSLLRIPLVGFEVSENMIEKTAVVILEEKTVPARYSWDEPQKKIIYGLTQSDKTGQGFLVRISTAGPYTKGTSGEIEAWKGTPQILASGSGAHGAAGRIGDWSDSLVIMREGDVLYVRPEGGYKTKIWALYVRKGQLLCEEWHPWKLQDAIKDPGFYCQKGTAPMGYVPTDWIGQIVRVCTLEEEQCGCGPEKIGLEEKATGELVKIENENNKVILNLGWDGQDYHESPVWGEWVILEPKKKVRPMSDEEQETRKALRTQADELISKAISATKSSYFQVVETSLQEEIREIANFNKGDFDTIHTNDGYESLTCWVRRTQESIAKIDQISAELQTLSERQKSGEVLVDFGGHFRRMGMSANSDYWVIKADGTLREPDSVEYRKKYTSEGDKKWRLVNDEELALSWYCESLNNTCASDFKVAKTPVNSCTPAQLNTVAQIETELAVPIGAFGLDHEAKKVSNERLAAIKKACQQSEFLARIPSHLDITKISGKWGQLVREDLSMRWSGNSTIESIENRNAFLVDTQPACDGILEFFVYEKWGNTNLNIRWRKNDSQELSTEVSKEQSEDESGELDLGALQKAWGKYNK